MTRDAPLIWFPSATLRVNSRLTMSGGQTHSSTPLDARLRGQDGGDIVGGSRTAPTGNGDGFPIGVGNDPSTTLRVNSPTPPDCFAALAMTKGGLRCSSAGALLGQRRSTDSSA